MKEQNVIINNLQKLCDVTTIISWQKLCERLPKNILIFAKKALVFSLPNNSNLKRWGKSSSDKCNLCQQKQTQPDVINNCLVSANSDRYLLRHNSILNTQHHYVSQVDGFDIFVHLPRYENLSNVFYDAVRPDIVLKRNHHIVVIELTCCFETNLLHSINFKIEKYKNIKNYSKVTVNKIKTFFLEVSSLGFIAKTFNPLKISF